MDIISVKISNEMQRRLQAAEKSKSVIVREALQLYVSDERGAMAGSCLALAHDLAGCCSGPTDLASDTKHMKDYGK